MKNPTTTLLLKKQERRYEIQGWIIFLEKIRHFLSLPKWKPCPVYQTPSNLEQEWQLLTKE